MDKLERKIYCEQNFRISSEEFQMLDKFVKYNISNRCATDVFESREKSFKHYGEINLFGAYPSDVKDFDDQVYFAKMKMVIQGIKEGIEFITDLDGVDGGKEGAGWYKK